LAQVRQGLGRIRFAHPENEAGAGESHRALNSNSDQHEGSLVAQAAAQRSIHLDENRRVF
jgi:hypothetical protein